MRAISSFSFDAGTSTRVWRDWTALRIRVSMSAIGSVIPCPRGPGAAPASRLQRARTTAARFPAVRPPTVAGLRSRPCGALPAALGHTRDLALEGELTETETAQGELPEVRPRPATPLAAVAGAHRKLVPALLFLRDLCGCRHVSSA